MTSSCSPSSDSTTGRSPPSWSTSCAPATSSSCAARSAATSSGRRTRRRPAAPRRRRIRGGAVPRDAPPPSRERQRRAGAAAVLGPLVARCGLPRRADPDRRERRDRHPFRADPRATGRGGAGIGAGSTRNSSPRSPGHRPTARWCTCAVQRTSSRPRRAPWSPSGTRPVGSGSNASAGQVTFLWVAFHDRPGSGGQRPPRVRSAMAISASGLW